MSYGFGITGNLMNGLNTDIYMANYAAQVGTQTGLSNFEMNSIYPTAWSNNFNYTSIPFAGYGVNNIQEMQQQNLMYNQANINNNLALQKQSYAASLLNTSDSDSINRQVAALQRQIGNNKQGNILPEYNKLLAAVRTSLESSNLGVQVSEEQVKAVAEKAYANATGMSLVDSIRANGSNSFVQGFKEFMSFGLIDGTTASENIEAITGENAYDGASKFAKNAGRVAACGLGVGLITGIVKLVKFIK